MKLCWFTWLMISVGTPFQIWSDTAALGEKCTNIESECRKLQTRKNSVFSRITVQKHLRLGPEYKGSYYLVIKVHNSAEGYNK